VATDPAEFIGKVVNGVVVFENGGTLPEGTPVRIEPLENELESTPPGRLAEMLLSHAGVINDPELPTDLAANLDHYLYGTPKSQ
jgi:hypothetical protein